MKNRDLYVKNSWEEKLSTEQLENQIKLHCWLTINGENAEIKYKTLLAETKKK